jgi:hypothetical protein
LVGLDSKCNLSVSLLSSYLIVFQNEENKMGKEGWKEDNFCVTTNLIKYFVEIIAHST